MDYSHWKSHFEGRLLTQADDEYAVTRRIWNGMIDKKPARIARCASAADVRAGVKLARAERMTISVRGGGHGVAGNAVCDGGMMLDLSDRAPESHDRTRPTADQPPQLPPAQLDRR